MIVVSDSVSSGRKKDKSGKIIFEKLNELQVRKIDFAICADKLSSIQSLIKKYCKAKTNIIITTGGTGASILDVTAEAIKPLLEKEMTGLMEAIRTNGIQLTPQAMFSNGVAGFIGSTLINSLPGSVSAVKDGLSTLFPYVFHLFEIRNGKRH